MSAAESSAAGSSSFNPRFTKPFVNSGKNEKEYPEHPMSSQIDQIRQYLVKFADLMPEDPNRQTEREALKDRLTSASASEEVKDRMKINMSEFTRQMERAKADAKDVDIWLDQIYTNRIREYPTYEQRAHKFAQEGIARMMKEESSQWDVKE
ncbi:hypothetical protein sscle_01g003760 [Sclerotinia sclerotiorum 1980 UF-70]|uniref:Uncharacterized protein n=1 Tax=Sclerotinia sclerotiorum (strain ATCC 18683 / 1980 / Ss-1) TaxID=665079 RepID=A0A1D9PSH7_SCLS1|nr:hypothetical protein sscle_01g003760 [Sclerotinia sclerotiorum 1980 UF-70]